MKIGILAYGSLIDDPGEDLAPLIVGRRQGVLTPFAVEFAHASVNRGGGPTLIPVVKGGAPVEAQLLLLRDGITRDEATHFVYAREIGRPGSGARYDPDAHKPNPVYVEALERFHGVDLVLYARTQANIEPLTAAELARRAVASAAGPAGERQLDGICYLMRAREHGTATPLMAEYERAVLRLTGAATLADAWRKARGQAAYSAAR